MKTRSEVNMLSFTPCVGLSRPVMTLAQPGAVTHWKFESWRGAKFQMPGLPEFVTVLFEDRDVPVVNGSFVDRFEEMDTHVYLFKHAA